MADFGGRYRQVRILGTGGMGEVWLALDVELGERPVAVKRMHSRMLADAKDVARFQREMRLAARMQHPNIMTLFTTGTDNGVPFMVMEYLQGQDLGKISRVRNADEVARVGRDTCAALEYAHGMGVVHRDIKPANLFLCDTGQVKVTDFGIARAVSGTSLTATGTLVGTLPYMAPEQWLGEPAAFSNDIWAVGCVLYELLSGRPPRTYASPTEYVAAAARREAISPLQPNASTPSWLADAIMAMLELDPRRRPSAAECVQLLSGPSAQRQEPPTVRRPVPAAAYSPTEPSGAPAPELGPSRPFDWAAAETAGEPNPAGVRPPGPPTIPARNGDFRQALRHLYERAGRPPTRNLVLPDGKRLLPGQAEEVLKDEKLPLWSRAEPVIIALGGDVKAFQELWSRRPDPERISTPQEAAAALQDIHTIAGRPDGYKFVLRLRGRELLSRAWWEIDGFLNACGVPSAEIDRWETAWQWIRKNPGPITARHFLRILGSSLVITVGAAIPFLLGDAVRHWGHPPHLGVGNYLALIPSLAVITVVAGAFVTVTIQLIPMRYKIVSYDNLIALMIIAYIMLLVLGLLLTPSDGSLAHLGENVRNWLGWRF